jgi:hypothetical protein
MKSKIKGKFSVSLAMLSVSIHIDKMLSVSIPIASFPCKLNTFRKRVKNVVTGKGIQLGIECK